MNRNTTNDCQLIDARASLARLAAQIQREAKQANVSRRLHDGMAAEAPDENGRRFHARQASAAYRHRNALRRSLLAVAPDSGITTR
jgi:hypothetical protein